MIFNSFAKVAFRVVDVRLVLHIPCECGLMGPCFLQCFGKQVLSKSRMRLVNLVLDKRAWVPIGPGSFIAIQGQSVRPVWHEISEDGGQPSCLGSPASREGGGPLKKQKKTRPWIRVASFFFC